MTFRDIKSEALYMR